MLRKILLSVAVLFVVGPAIAYDPIIDTRKIMAGTVTTTSIKNEYLSGKRDGTAPFQGALKAYKTVREAEQAAPTPVPQPVPAPTPIPAPTPAPTPTPPASTHIENKVAAEGDSITNVCPVGFYCGVYKATHPTVTLQGFGVSGSDIGMVTSRIDKVRATNAKVVTLLIGANDLYNGQMSVTVDMWLAKVWAYTDKLRAEGYKVAVGTILPQCCINSASYITEFTRRRPIANAAIRAAVGTHIDAVIDFAADPVIGVDFTARNPLFPDGLHPSSGYNTDTTTAHYRMSLIYAPVVDKLLAAGGTSVPAPTPAPAPVPVPAPTPIPAPAPSGGLTGAAPIASNFDVNQTIWLTGAGIPKSGAPDVVGAFRFICGAGQLSYDDPILFPGQPGKSHLHQFYGNVAANAHSTYASLRAVGDSTCNWTGKGFAANRSAYWMPAMLDGKGNVVRPDYVSIYYKERPQYDPVGSYPPGTPVTPLTSTDQRYAQGKAVQLPNGIKFIFGWDPTGLNQIRTGGMWFNCQGPTAKPGHYTTLGTALANCPAGNQVGAVINAPDCWDGKNLDSADHRSHVAYATYAPGYLKCPDKQPYVIPTFTMGAWYTVAAGDNTSLWELSSDMMAPGQPKGHTFHADFFMAWDPTVHDMWWQNCINKLLNCSGGQLGNGQDLKGAAQPIYNGTPRWTHPQRLVPIPGA